MTVFASTADAVRCAVAMQQAARRRVAGERLSIRVGLNVGEALREEPTTSARRWSIARRLCERAQGGQILCSGLVAGLLAGQQAFSFRDCGALELKGLTTPVAASEVLYRHDEPTALLAHTPFVGRAARAGEAHAPPAEARAGHGGLVLLAGEPGIGKTRMTEEFAESASRARRPACWPGAATRASGRRRTGRSRRRWRPTRATRSRNELRAGSRARRAAHRPAGRRGCASACRIFQRRWRCSRTRNGFACSMP